MSTSRHSEQELPRWRRAVLKVGSSLLAANGGGLSTRHALGLAEFIASSHRAGREVVLVSSGAVAAGRALVRAQPEAAHGLAARQALAAIGQTTVVALWQRFFDRPVAQVLLTHDDLRNRRRYLNARATLRELLSLGALPVVNENDTVAVDELKLGDNDNLAAIVAALVDADLLLIATDIDGLYSANPRSDPAAQAIDDVAAVTPQVLAMAGGAGSSVGTGGMLTKLEAATKAATAGIGTVLFNGTDAQAMRLLAADRLRGTRFRAGETRLHARKYWLRHAPLAGGRIRVDAGAARALQSGGASLLPGGIVGVSGEFARGDMVEIETMLNEQASSIARGISQYAAGEVRRIAGRKSAEIEGLLGYSYGETVVHRDDLVATAGANP
ncbi:glutamate 5-kinase [Tahibacter aquaticus]|uniref:Glutamate 5-kinase n=1 Tax=Tahibacter aquaticus TaxID=520092 RepID=A0A4R6YRN3_9GAMM|nr:glutamate 5-kinase [Tahibacter aquaticus]TDR40775.1 glutamate 5-kinase [Tahibacter aquaticus]